MVKSKGFVYGSGFADGDDRIGIKLALYRAMLGLAGEPQRTKLLGQLLTSIYTELAKSHPAPPLELGKPRDRLATYARFLELAPEFPAGSIPTQMQSSGVGVGKEYLQQFGTIRTFKSLQRLFQMGDIVLGTHPVTYTHSGPEINEDKCACLLNDAVYRSACGMQCSELCSPFITGLMEGMGYGPSTIVYHRSPAKGVYCNRTIRSEAFAKLE